MSPPPREHRPRQNLQDSAIRPAGEKGNLFLVSPPAYRACGIRGMSVGKDAADGSLIIRIPLVFEESRIRWKSNLANLPEN
ncbi:MAG: hypothetical protein ACLFSE_09735 [Spirochaetia bacterium]